MKIPITLYEIRTKARSEFGITAPNGLVLLTESGYLMLVKSFTDDLAWAVQRDLVNKYFRVKAQKTGHTTEYHKILAESRLNNSRARLSGQWLKLAELVDVPEYKQICAHYASGVLSGNPVIPLPLAGERYFSAKEVGELCGVSAKKIGMVAKQEGLKTEKYGKWFFDKSPYSNKEVESFKYNGRAIERFKEIIGSS